MAVVLKNLTTGEKLGLRMNGTEKDCILCSMGKETRKHIFFECDMSRLIWGAFDVYGVITNNSQEEFHIWLEKTLNVLFMLPFVKICIYHFLIYNVVLKARNETQFQDDRWTPLALIQQIRLYVNDLRMAF